MYTRHLISEDGMETIKISPYGGEWWIEGRLVKTFLTEDMDADIADLQEEGWKLIDFE